MSEELKVELVKGIVAITVALIGSTRPSAVVIRRIGGGDERTNRPPYRLMLFTLLLTVVPFVAMRYLPPLGTPGGSIFTFYEPHWNFFLVWAPFFWISFGALMLSPHEGKQKENGCTGFLAWLIMPFFLIGAAHLFTNSPPSGDSDIPVQPEQNFDETATSATGFQFIEGSEFVTAAAMERSLWDSAVCEGKVNSIAVEEFDRMPVR